MLTIEFKGIEQAVRDLKAFKAKAIPFAIRNSLNRSAEQTQWLWQRELGERLTLRNRWTQRTILVQKVRGSDPSTMFALVGSTEDYVRTQEFGGLDRGPIPTPVSSGEGRGARPRRKLVRKPNRLATITLAGRKSVTSRKQRNAIAIARAVRAGKKFVFLELERRKGIFKLKGGKRNPSVDMIWDTSRKSVRVPPTPTLGPTMKRLESKYARIHLHAMVEQLKRHRILGW